MDRNSKLILAAIPVGVGILSYQWYVRHYVLPKTTPPMDSFVLSPDQFKPFKLQSIRKYNHNTSIFRFSLDSITANDKQQTTLPVASYLLLKDHLINNDGKEEEIIRPYTPINSNCSKGYFELMIKNYPTGKMSPLIHSKKPGDTILVKGPMSKFTYTANSKSKIGMIAGGTGITPMLQVINRVLQNKEDNTKISLLFGNVSEQDILLKEEIDKLANENSDRFEVHYAIDKPSSSSITSELKHEVGVISEEMIKKYIPKPANDSLVLVCGPPKMMELVSGKKAVDYSQGELTGILKKLGYSNEQVFKY